jgi:hypothetical protein
MKLESIYQCCLLSEAFFQRVRFFGEARDVESNSPPFKAFQSERLSDRPTVSFRFQHEILRTHDMWFGTIFDETRRSEKFFFLLFILDEIVAWLIRVRRFLTQSRCRQLTVKIAENLYATGFHWAPIKVSFGLWSGLDCQASLIA